jgi:hypothetical protein
MLSLSGVYQPKKEISESKIPLPSPHIFESKTTNQYHLSASG